MTGNAGVDNGLPQLICTPPFAVATTTFVTTAGTIQPMFVGTRAYKVGRYPVQKLTTPSAPFTPNATLAAPAKTGIPSTATVNGPPLSPEHAPADVPPNVPPLTQISFVEL